MVRFSCLQQIFVPQGQYEITDGVVLFWRRRRIETIAGVARPISRDYRAEFTVIGHRESAWLYSGRLSLHRTIAGYVGVRAEGRDSWEDGIISTVETEPNA